MKKVREILSVIILLGIISLFFILNITSFEKDLESELTIELPKSTVYYIKFDAIQFLKELSLVTIFDVKDQDFFTRLKSKIDALQENESPLMDLGIDQLKPVELIVCDIQDKPHVFSRFTVINKDAFLKFSETYNLPCSIHGSYGYISLGSNKEYKFDTLFSEMAMHQLKSDIKGELILYEFNAGKHISTYEFDNANKAITLMISQQNSSHKTHYIPEEKGVEFCWVPSTIEKEWLCKNDNSLKPFLSSIEYFSAAYGGFSFLDNSSLPGIPIGSLLISFKDPQSKSQVLANANELFRAKNTEIIADAIEFSDNLSLFCYEISPTTFVFSFSNQKPKIKEISTPNKYLGGELSYLLEIKNTGYYAYIIDAIPGFNTSKEILKSTKPITKERVNDKKEKMVLAFEKPKGFYSGLIELISIFI